MLSRVANSVYWMSRYLERAENVARFIDVNYNLTLGEGTAFNDRWAPLVFTTGDHEQFEERFSVASCENVVQFLAFDTENPNSIASCVAAARENARTIRETITSPMWEHVNRFYLLVMSAAESGEGLRDAVSFCKAVRDASHSLVGTTYTTMSHGEAWHFLRLGRLLERADKTSRIADVQYYLLLPKAEDVGSSLDIVRWSALLKSASALEMYRRGHGSIVPKKVAQFLLLDKHFPRSVHFCVRGAQDSICAITGSQPQTYRVDTEKLIGRLASEFVYTSIDDIIARGMHEFIDEFQTSLNQVGEAIHDDFFTVPERVEMV